MESGRRILATFLSGMLALLAVATAAATPAAAATASGVVASNPAPSMTLSSTQAGGGADIDVHLSFSYAQPADTIKNLTVTLPPGMWAAPGALAGTCSSAQLDAHACPATAEIGSGVANLTLTNGSLAGLPGGGANQTAQVALYLMPASGSDVAGVGAIITDSAMGVTVSATGTANLLNGSTPSPQLSVTLENLPQSVNAGPLSGLVTIQVNAMELKLDANAPSASGSPDAGSQFIYLPKSCQPASIALSVDTYAATGDGAATLGFTPTGCPLAFAPQLSVSATRDRGDAQISFQNALTIPAQDASLNALTMRIPATLIGPNAMYGRVQCSATAPFTGCPVVGSVVATSPLTAAPLTGTIALTGSIVDLGLGLDFPPPYSLSLSGHIQLSSPYVVTFRNLPDVPLTRLVLSFPGGANGAFIAVCGHLRSAPVTASATGAGGARAQISAPLTMRGCPAPRRPRVSLGFALTTAAGHARPRTLKLALPPGLSFSASGLGRALKVRGAREHAKLDHGVLVLALSRPGRRLSVTLASAGIAVARANPGRRLRVTVTDEHGKSTHLVFMLRFQR